MLFAGNGVTSKIKPIDNIKDVCAAINNKDVRCSEPDKFATAPIFSKWGYADGVVGVIAIADKSTMKLNPPCGDGRFASCTFYKVVVEHGKLPTVEGVASLPNEGKCKWTALALGGAVCQSYNWDYRKDNQASIVLQ